MAEMALQSYTCYLQHRENRGCFSRSSCSSQRPVGALYTEARFRKTCMAGSQFKFAGDVKIFISFQPRIFDSRGGLHRHSSQASGNSRINTTVCTQRRHQHTALASHVGGEAAISEDLGFWERLKEAWRVLVGAPQLLCVGPKNTINFQMLLTWTSGNPNLILFDGLISLEKNQFKARFTRLLIRDRGFNSTNLSRLYNAAKGAIMEHVDLEDQDLEVTAAVQRLGEVQLYFHVRRLKSDLLIENYTEEAESEFRPTIASHLLWENPTPSMQTCERVITEFNEDLGQTHLGHMTDSIIPRPSMFDENEEKVPTNTMATRLQRRWREGGSDRVTESGSRTQSD